MNSLATLLGVDWGDVGYVAGVLALGIAAVFTATGY